MSHALVHPSLVMLAARPRLSKIPAGRVLQFVLPATT
jgi:hypothetical protein